MAPRARGRPWPSVCQARALLRYATTGVATSDLHAPRGFAGPARSLQGRSGARIMKTTSCWHLTARAL